MSHLHTHGTNRRGTSRAGSRLLGPLSMRAVLQNGSLLVKVDRPRQIDPYIDYFGEGMPATPPPRFVIGRAG